MDTVTKNNKKNTFFLLAILIVTIAVGFFASQFIIQATSNDLNPNQASAAAMKAVKAQYGSTPDIQCTNALKAEIGATTKCSFYHESGKKYVLVLTVKKVASDGDLTLGFKSSAALS